MKIRGKSGKWIIKEIARRHLPDNIIDRKKVGFRVPLDEWFRGGLKDYVHDLLLGKDSFVSNYLDRRTIQKLLDSHMSGRRNEELRLWTLLGFEVWQRTFLRDAVQAHATASV
jgi:asparagine synthase (glutamine-hydrolysing)